MDAATKGKFVLALHKHSLQALATGGFLPGVSNALTVTNGYNASAPTSVEDLHNQQAGLANQLQNEAAGNGPNPAQMQYGQNAEKIAQSQATANAQNRALNPAAAARLSSNAAVNVGEGAAATEGIQQAEQQIAAQQQLAGLTGQEQAGLLGTEQINSGVAQNNANAQNQSAQGLISGASSVLGAFAAAKGGRVPGPHMMADGGSISVPNAPVYAPLPNYGVQSNADITKVDNKGASDAGSSAGKWLKGKFEGSLADTDVAGGTSMAGGADSLSELLPVAAMAAKGGLMHAAPSSLMTKGGPVQAQTKNQKATVQGNSYKNDKIPALLSEDEEVLPREVMQSKNPPKAAAAFVRAEMAKKGLKSMHGLSLSGKSK